MKLISGIAYRLIRMMLIVFSIIFKWISHFNFLIDLTVCSDCIQWTFRKLWANHAGHFLVNRYVSSWPSVQKATGGRMLRPCMTGLNNNSTFLNLHEYHKSSAKRDSHLVTLLRSSFSPEHSFKPSIRGIPLVLAKKLSSWEDTQNLVFKNLIEIQQRQM